jgi:hypothetical protein
MSIMSGYIGQRALSDFISRNKSSLLEYFNFPRTSLPSRRAISEVFKWVDFEELVSVFYKWSQSYAPILDKEWIAIDGKVIGGTVINANDSKQNYINLVSLFSHKRKQVISCGLVEGNKESELPVTRLLIDELDIKDAIFTLDALHCQKDTVKTITNNGNDYVIGVKGNQPNLLKAIKKTL